MAGCWIFSRCSIRHLHGGIKKYLFSQRGIFLTVSEIVSKCAVSDAWKMSMYMYICVYTDTHVCLHLPHLTATSTTAAACWRYGDHTCRWPVNTASKAAQTSAFFQFSIRRFRATTKKVTQLLHTKFLSLTEGSLRARPPVQPQRDSWGQTVKFRFTKTGHEPALGHKYASA